MKRRQFVAAAFAAGWVRADNEPRIYAPLDYQVVQRHTRRPQPLPISGSSGFGQASARLNGGKWQQLSTDLFQSQLGSYRGLFEVPGGGFYPLKFRFGGNGAGARELSVHVGIGEVFVIAGQSNSTNYGEEPQTVRHGMTSAFDGERWRIADDPQPGVQDNSKRGSFIPAFGDALSEKLGVPIGIACVGHGSTSVRQWLPEGDVFDSQPTMTRFVSEAAGGKWKSDGKLFEGLIARMKALGPQQFRAVLWHQGESDAHQAAGHGISGAEYRKMLTRIIEESRRRAGWRVPWMVAQASYHSAADPGDPEIRSAQAEICKSGLALQGPDTDQLGPEYREKNGAGVHFNAKGLAAHGQLWAEKVAAYVERVAPRI